ncbi:esterase-like activity of phytase family protein [Aliinostoc sp. HNIBRCY26]|uniref:esterase-like activity of phytase family protein n=1 Tax=Aliinostoc sp. HNIBRCY26 TaxID=3418997 RepID=UPI003D016749
MSSLNSLPADISAIPVQKRLLLTLNSSNLVGNVEGLAFGPTLPNGRLSIVMVVDNRTYATGTSNGELRAPSAQKLQRRHSNIWTF